MNSTIYLWDNLEIIALEYFSWHRKIRLENEGDGSESVMKCFSVLTSRKQGRSQGTNEGLKAVIERY